MSDPQPPGDLPTRPPLPAQAAPGDPQPGEDTDAAEQTRRVHARGPAPQYAPTSAPEYGVAPTPPPNPFGQPATGRHANPSSANPSAGSQWPTPLEQPFAPPSSPDFGPAAAQGAAYGSNPQQPYGQQPAPTTPGYDQPGYVQPSYPTMQQYPTPVKPRKPAARLANTGLVLGVIGLIGGIFFGWTLLLSIAAVVLGFLSRPREPHARGIALSAIVTGFVGVLLSLGWLTYSILTWLALTAS